MEWIRKNLLDRADIYENFLTVRRTIISEMQRVGTQQIRTACIQRRKINTTSVNAIVNKTTTRARGHDGSWIDKNPGATKYGALVSKIR